MQNFLAACAQADPGRDHVEGIAKAMPRRRLLIDVGAGDGSHTRRLAPHFDGVTAIEPNPLLGAELRRACPTATVLTAPLDEVRPPDLAHALDLAEFMLGAVPPGTFASRASRASRPSPSDRPSRPSRTEVERYLTDQFAVPDGGFTFTYDRAVLRIRKPR
ncbi:hypothetical protein [Streptomyces sp. NPDC058401]|uniref:hypothetical protein n=1 Tax=Streptomyces sp. NPDC058401 TaxID=3346480 RepID=UPI0036692771